MLKQKKLRILQSYISDLTEQNDVLLRTVEDLEREANDRVSLLEGKLQQAQTTVKVGWSFLHFVSFACTARLMNVKVTGATGNGRLF